MVALIVTRRPEDSAFLDLIFFELAVRRSELLLSSAKLSTNMVETRRKSRIAHASEADSDAHIVIPDDIDHEELAALLPDVDLHSPSPEAIVTFYKLLLAQAADLDASQRQLDEAHGETEKKEVELDQALQDRESATKELEGSVESLQEELNLVKRERDELGRLFIATQVQWLMMCYSAQAQSNLKAEINTLSNSQSSSSSEVETLKHRVEDTDREKRDLVGVISRLKQESAQRDGKVSFLLDLFMILKSVKMKSKPFDRT